MDRQLTPPVATAGARRWRPERVVLVALSLAAATAAGETRALYGGSVQAALASAPTTFDPLHGGPGDAEVAVLVYDTPFLVDGAGRPRPSLALALDNPEGGLRARLVLRPELRFSDGSALTARDVAASLTRALRDPGGWTLGPIRAVRAAGDETVELELLRPTPELALLLSTPAAMITPNGMAPAKRPIGSGPFLVEASDGQSVRLAANPSCANGRPYLASLILRAWPSRGDEAGSFEVGALQAMRHLSAATIDQAGPRHASLAVDGPATITGFIAVGRSADAALVRRILALALNRERLRRLTVREPALVAAGAVPPALGGTSERPAYDPARARGEVERRWPGARPKLSLLVDASRFDDRDVAERILADLARAGIDVSIDAVDAATYQTRVDGGRYELLLGAAAPPAPAGPLAALALVAAVDPAAARSALAHGSAVDLETTRVVPLFHRAARLQVAPELRDLRVDGAGRVAWPDVHWLAR
jgi:peptide/nickel transport system substrate-binding protein